MTGRSVVKRASNSASGSPCGCSVSGCSRIRSTTLTSRTRRSGRCSRRSPAAATVSSVGTSPAQASTTSGTPPSSVPGPVPDPDAARAVRHGLLHRQPLRRRRLAGHDHVDVVARAQAVVGHREQRVGVRRQVDPHDLGLLVDHVVDEAGVLVGEAVVVLPPHVRGEQIVERGDRPPPRDAPGHLQPLRVLVEHRVDDVDERLVAGEQPVAAGQQVALQPALAQVLGQDLHHPPVRGEVVVAGQRLRVPRPVGDLERRAQPVGGDLVRARTGGSCSGFASIRRTSRRKPPEHPRGLGPGRAPAR